MTVHGSWTVDRLVDAYTRALLDGVLAALGDFVDELEDRSAVRGCRHWRHGFIHDQSTASGNSPVPSRSAEGQPRFGAGAVRRRACAAIASRSAISAASAAAGMTGVAVAMTPHAIRGPPPPFGNGTSE